jgi:hypothetical protein
LALEVHVEREEGKINLSKLDPPLHPFEILAAALFEELLLLPSILTRLELGLEISKKLLRLGTVGV